jgi:hypothetical protein
MREIKRRVERSQKPLPGLLAESDIDSDSDNESLSSDPVIDSGGDKVDERDFRSDHPRQMEEPPDNEADLGPPSQPEPPPSPTVTVTTSRGKPQHDDGLGESSDGKSRRICQWYQVLLRDKQVPPAVRRGLHLRKIICLAILVLKLLMP